MMQGRFPSSSRADAHRLVFFHAESRPCMPNCILDAKSKTSLETFVSMHDFKVGSNAQILLHAGGA
jgi:hypothetical protein